MGWRQRDYARLNDDERRALFGSGRGGNVPPSAPGRSHERTSPATLLAVAISGAAILFGGYVENVAGLRTVLDPPPHPTVTFTKPLGGTTWAKEPNAPLTSQPSIPVVQPGGTLTVVWQAGDLAPAAHAGRVCVVADGPGQICASFVVGERPADNLTREIERRGLRVRSSG